MNNEERRRRQFEHLEKRREQMNEHIEKQRQRLNDQINRRQAQLNQTLNPKQEEIIAAALKLLDIDGLNELSLRKLAKTLDLQAPALYWHFANKETLIDYMAEAILQEALGDFEARAAAQSWQDWLIDACKRLRQGMLAHRDGARIVAGAHLYPALTLGRLFNMAGESLISAGLDDRRAGLITSTAVHFTFGRVIEEQSAPSLEQLERMGQSGAEAFFKEFPYLLRSADQHAADIKSGYDEFEDALRLIIHD